MAKFNYKQTVSYVPSHVLGLYQEGGQMMQGEPSPTPEGAGAPPADMGQILQMAMQAVQEGNPDMAMQVCQMLVQMAQGMQGEQGAEAPMGEEAAPAPEGAPM